MNKKDAQRLRENVIKANKKKSKPKRLTPSQLKSKHFEKSETQEQNDLCRWLKQTYPEILYTVDIAGVGLTKAQRIIYRQRAKKGHPDIIIQEWCRNIFCGLAIELKREKIVVNYFELSKPTDKGRHLTRQHQYLMDLRKRDYLAVFVSGAEKAKKVVSLYMEGTDSALKEINNYVFPPIKFNKILR